MNSLIVLRTLGMLLLCEAVAMLPPVVVALIYREDTVFAFLISMAVAVLIGLMLFSIRVKQNNKIQGRFCDSHLWMAGGFDIGCAAFFIYRSDNILY